MHGTIPNPLEQQNKSSSGANGLTSLSRGSHALWREQERSLPSTTQDSKLASFTLKSTPSINQVSEFEVNVTMRALGREMKLTQSLVETVTSVEPNGNFRTRTEVASNRFTVNGMPYGVPRPDPVEATYSPLSEALEMKGLKNPVVSARFDNLTSVVFPTEPLNVGSVWKRSVKANPATGLPAGEGRYEIKGIHDIGGAQVAEISFTFVESGGASSRGTEFVRISDGKSLKGSVKITNFQESPSEPAHDQEISFKLTKER